MGSPHLFGPADYSMVSKSARLSKWTFDSRLPCIVHGNWVYELLITDALKISVIRFVSFYIQPRTAITYDSVSKHENFAVRDCEMNRLPFGASEVKSDQRPGGQANNILIAGMR